MRLAVVLAALGILAAACQRSARPVTDPSSLPLVPPGGDTVTALAVAGDPASLMSMFRYQRAPCSHASDSPSCTAVQADGTIVDVFPVTGCGRRILQRPEQVRDLLHALMAPGSLALFGSVQQDKVVDRLIFAGTGGPGGFWLDLEDGQPVALGYICVPRA